MFRINILPPSSRLECGKYVVRLYILQVPPNIITHPHGGGGRWSLFRANIIYLYNLTASSPYSIRPWKFRQLILSKHWYCSGCFHVIPWGRGSEDTRTSAVNMGETVMVWKRRISRITSEGGWQTSRDKAKVEGGILLIWAGCRDRTRIITGWGLSWKKTAVARVREQKAPSDFD
jgi:hypothetical protein